MRKNNLKSFALLFFFNSFYLSFFFYFLPLHYFFSVLIFFAAINTWLLFFPVFPFIQKFNPRLAFPTEGIFKIWKEEKKDLSKKKALCYIVEKEIPFTLHFSGLQTHSAVFSRGLLALLTVEELKALVCYFWTLFSAGWSLFFTLLSFFCFPIRALLFLLEIPFHFIYSIFKFLKNSVFLNKEKMTEDLNDVTTGKQKRSEILFPLFFKLLSLSFYRVFLCMDKKAYQKPAGKALGSALWKVQSFYEVENVSPPLWMSLLFFGNPLTFRVYKWYFSFQPQLRSRVKTLIGSYPP